MTERPVVLITGGTRGIGRATCEALQVDHHILVGGRDAELAEEVASRLESAEPWVCDITDESSVERAVQDIEVLDAVVHSAGLEGMGSLDSRERDEWRRVFELNVFAVADLTRLLLPKLRARKGTVVAINSGSGLTSRAGAGLYCSSKFALTAYTDALREEELGRVRVVSVHPGRVDTEMQERIVAVQGGEYRAGEYLRAGDVATVIASTIRLPAAANLDTVSVRPWQ